MTMRAIYGAAPADLAGYDTARLRSEFLVEGLFQQGELSFVYTHLDRMILGGAVPTETPLAFGAGADVGTEYLLSAREMGIANLGGAGSVTVDGQAFSLASRDVLYVGRGGREISLASDHPQKPAWFYMNSVPAGHDVSHRLIRRVEAKAIELGEERRANKRTLRMYIHPEVAPSCLLLMGITDLAPGSVWNTMPPHLHDRRSEVYFYFDLGANDRVFHFMGQPDAQRHIVVQNDEAVISPPWSIHMGSGTSNYAFIWAMGGENLDYTDMNVLDICQLK